MVWLGICIPVINGLMSWNICIQIRKLIICLNSNIRIIVINPLLVAQLMIIALPRVMALEYEGITVAGLPQRIPGEPMAPGPLMVVQPMIMVWLLAQVFIGCIMVWGIFINLIVKDS